MTNLGNKKILLIIGVVILLLGIPVAIYLVSRPAGFRLGAQTPNTPEGVSVSGVTTSGATITWTTPIAGQGGVSYGLSASSLIFFKPDAGETTNHVINLEGLVGGSPYFFVIKVGENSYDNGGKPYTFETKPTPPPPLPLSLPTSLPPSSLTEEGLLGVMGTANAAYDLNKDGVVNLMDLEFLRKQTK
ncbi:hypothetical protein COT65_00425 [Candidatus Shapirobacteria bacterium CG09_land_8_20_14_0_10_47_13]|uniref:Fibronectin type-III domain-containing protein n=1 Tax=Candidatus Shapirobacteria bacterium CG09_land_8_20_14_0_10_47_13 TaxID=1974481 RepID=A0A2H0WNC4_9BACT|nr:MAG: hypothetical protein COT65_00425 [Candidatus Shapirobacteria bacterium CG09_land_8_20_14_0_10_47_13]